MDDREDKIRARAYAIWQQEGCPEGRSLDHWLKAESEISTDLLAVESKLAMVSELPKAA